MVKILTPSKHSSQYSLITFYLMLFIQRHAWCLTYLRKQWACAGFFMENTAWIKYHENRSMNSTLKKQIFPFFHVKHINFLLEKKCKFSICVFFSPQKYVNSLPLLFLFLFSFNVSFSKRTILTRSIFLKVQT